MEIRIGTGIKMMRRMEIKIGIENRNRDGNKEWNKNKGAIRHKSGNEFGIRDKDRIKNEDKDGNRDKITFLKDENKDGKRDRNGDNNSNRSGINRD